MPPASAPAASAVLLRSAHAHADRPGMALRAGPAMRRLHTSL